MLRVAAAFLFAPIATEGIKAQQHTMYVEPREYRCDTAFELRIRSVHLRRTVALQGSLRWDTAVIQYRSIVPGTGPITLNETNMNTLEAGNGSLSFLWFDNFLNGVNQSADTALFSILFAVNLRAGGRSDVQWISTPTQLEIDTLDLQGEPRKHNEAVFTDGYAFTPAKYRFTGIGAWSDAANWERGQMPPATLPECSEIRIDPPAGEECVLSGLQTISRGGVFTVEPGKRMRVLGDLRMQ